MTAAITCRVTDCETRTRGGGIGYCKLHYTRFIKWGDPLTVGKRGKTGSSPGEYIPTPARPKIVLKDGDPLPCTVERELFDAVLDQTCWWVGAKPGKGATRVIDNAKAVCHACPLMDACRARNRDLSGVVGGEYRPHTATEATA